MKLHCLANAPGTSYVGQFNYISIYPWWTPPVIPAANFPVTGLSSVSNYATALSNATNIQNAVNLAGANGGGTVLITNGSFYLAQQFPNETAYAYFNGAVYVTNSNIAIRGNGITNTTLIGFNRATTLLSVGADQGLLYQCKNIVLRDMTLEARPNWAVSNTISGTNTVSGTNIAYDGNNFVMSAQDDQNTNLTIGFETGTICIFWGPVTNANFYSYNLLITNCSFVNGYNQLTIWDTYVSNVFVTACNFLWNSNVFYGNVGLFGQGNNFVLLNNTFNGNTNLAPTNYEAVSTNSYYGGIIASVGLSWLQY
jgi:hypothetical protein